MTAAEADRVVGVIRGGRLSGLLPAAAVAVLRDAAQEVLQERHILRLDDGEVLTEGQVRAAPLVSAVAVDEALCVARRRPWQTNNVIIVGRRADSSLVTVKLLDAAGWRRVDGGWQHDRLGWRRIVGAEEYAAYVWLSGAPRVEWVAAP